MIEIISIRMIMAVINGCTAGLGFGILMNGTSAHSVGGELIGLAVILFGLGMAVRNHLFVVNYCKEKADRKDFD